MRPARPLDALDLAILAITAVVGLLAAARNDLEYTEIYLARGGSASERTAQSLAPWARAIRGSARRIESDATALLSVLTLGIGLAILIRPGELRARRWPGPGIAAASVGSVVILLMLAWHAYLCSKGQYWLSRDMKDALVIGAVHRCQYRAPRAILGSWTVLVIAGRWRPRSGGLDRLGRLVGWAWVVRVGLETLWPGFWL